MSAAPPVNPTTSRLVSRFGVRPSRRDGSPHMHAGVDIGSARPSNQDEPIFAAKGGTVTLVGENTPTSNMSGYGNCVVVRHSDGTYALYAHLKDGSVTVRQGQTVTGGQQIAMMGNTTNGNFSPLPGQSVAEWTAQARARGYRGAPMVRHLHFELRNARADGSSPFPGPYPQRPDQALYNQDPQPWLRNLGVNYSPRGAATITPGSDADTSHSWSRSMAGTLAVLGVDDLAAVGQGYEPVEFERDTRFGLTRNEWIAVGVGGVAVVGLAVALGLRSRRVATNRRRGPRSNRLRTWGAK